MTTAVTAPPRPQTAALPHRWTIAMAGLAIQTMLGSVYAWSIFKMPLCQAHGWREFDVGITFALTILCLGISAALGGRLVDRAGTRAVAGLAGVLFGAGTILAGVGHQFGNLYLLWLGYGVIGGIGNGLAYITPVAVLARWFPEKKGFITGMVVMGFGMGAALMTVLGQGMIQSLGPGAGVYTTFYIAGAIFLAGIVLASRKLVNPPEGYGRGLAHKGAAPDAYSFTVAQARRMPQLYLLWGILFLNVIAGIALLSNLSPMAQKNLAIDGVAASAIVLMGSFCNAFGRLFWGGLSEKLGRRNVFLMLYLTQIPLLVLLPHVENYWGFALIACYILLCYGGGFGTMPSFTADTFGPKNIGAIYGMVLFAWGLAGGLGPGLMEWIRKSTGSFALALYIAAGLLAAGVVLALLYRKPPLPRD